MNEQTTTTPKTTCKKGNHTTNYTMNEDIKLCELWLHCSQNPVHSPYQTNSQLWKDINAKFVAARKGFENYTPRSGLKARWAKISRCCLKYHKHYKQAKHILGPDASELSAITKAEKLYYDESVKIGRSPRRFVWSECLSILMKCPKWRQKADLLTSASPPVDEEVAEDEAYDSDSSTDSKNAKEEHWTDESIFNDIYEFIAEQLHQWTEYSKIEAEIMEEQIDHEVMSVDVENITNPVRAEYYKRRQKQILDKIISKKMQE